MARVGYRVYNGKRWVKQQMEPHPLVNGLWVMVDEPGYSGFGFSVLKKVHPIVVSRLADTGAQMTVIS